ncbi:aldose 1-epimerase family protein [Promicromonospora thailandica]|uniref:aldose 1-epimerase family protein n=1 Tax=Promicromonospora thailandica TaxID=765201 RepID=UPI0020A4FDB1|nr:aldose 1-epimerase family protein [Promicromonospora thailandica]
MSVTTEIPPVGAASPHPSGDQFRIGHGAHRATVTQVGAALREYSVDGRDVVVPFGVDEINPVFNSAVLIPWPNRLADGAYEYGGVTHQLPITEPDRRTALHGLAAFERWSVVEHTGSAVTLELELVARPGYPFQLVVQIRYALSDAGLEITLDVTNVGTDTAPYGCGFHPWLSTGGAPLDECTVRLDAATRVTTDERLLPTGTEPASSTYDLREPRSAAGLDLDDAYVDVVRDEQGLSWAHLAGPDGRTAAVWMDGSQDVWQICTGDHIQPERRRMGLAAEPMSCVADAFRTGERLVHLAPGERHAVRWGMTLL